MTTTIPATCHELHDVTLGVAFLEHLWGVEIKPVTHADIPRVDCEQCDLIGAKTVARVYGDPRPGATSDAMTDCCLHCIEHTVKQAHAYQRDGSARPIYLELAS